MKVYIAGTWEQRLFVKELAIYLKKEYGEGLSIFDWTEHCKADCAFEYAKADMDGVVSCDAFVLVDPNTFSRGKFVEFGMALALKKFVIVLMDREQKTDTIGIFGHLRHLFNVATCFRDVFHLTVEHAKGMVDEYMETIK